MDNTRDLPQSELEVMGVLWRKGEATVREVQSVLNGKSKRAYTTVATLLNRLREKGFVEAEERNFAYVFRPLAQRDQVVRRKLDDMVDRVFGGNIAPLAAYIAENRKLNPEQIAALEEIVKSESGKEDK
jgi:predicted transcriptional regulator